MNKSRNVLVVAVAVIAVAGVSTAISDLAADSAGEASSPTANGPVYANDGSLRRPRDFRTWVFVGASLGLTYSEHAEKHDEQRFHNVYIQPHAYRHYVRTGTFPEKTMLAMTLYSAKKKATAPPKLQGLFEGDLLSLEVAVKDSERFEDEWAYFDFAGDARPLESAKPFARTKCYDCHAEHAEDDNVFVQFYPVLRRVKEGAE